MRKYLLHVLIVSFVFLLAPTVHVAAFADKWLEEKKEKVRKNPDDAKAHYNLGNAYGKSGKYKEAIEAYKQAIRIDPDFAWAHGNLGNAYGELGKYKEAIESYKQVIRIDPDDATAHYNLGSAYGKSGKYEEAIESYKQAIRIDPDWAPYHYNLGLAYGESGMQKEAMESYKQAINNICYIKERNLKYIIKMSKKEINKNNCLNRRQNQPIRIVLISLLGNTHSLLSLYKLN